VIWESRAREKSAKVALISRNKKSARFLACSTHVYVEMNFPGESAGEENEQFECIAADVFLG
jgi:hypothetical protein